MTTLALVSDYGSDSETDDNVTSGVALNGEANSTLYAHHTLVFLTSRPKTSAGGESDSSDSESDSSTSSDEKESEQRYNLDAPHANLSSTASSSRQGAFFLKACDTLRG
jgi:hypothetical protein